MRFTPSHAGKCLKYRQVFGLPVARITAAGLLLIETGISLNDMELSEQTRQGRALTAFQSPLITGV